MEQLEYLCHEDQPGAAPGNAKAMANSGLIQHGWMYMNIDDCWQGRRGGLLSCIMPDSGHSSGMQGSA